MAGQLFFRPLAGLASDGRSVASLARPANIWGFQQVGDNQDDGKTHSRLTFEAILVAIGVGGIISSNRE